MSWPTRKNKVEDVEAIVKRAIPPKITDNFHCFSPHVNDKTLGGSITYTISLSNR